MAPAFFARDLVFRGHLELQTRTSTGGLVVIDQFYYPAWQARVVGGTPVEFKPVMPQGLLGMYVAPGHEQARLDIPVGKAEIVGQMLSVASVLVWGILFWIGKGSSVGSYAVPRATAAALNYSSGRREFFSDSVGVRRGAQPIR